MKFECIAIAFSVATIVVGTTVVDARRRLVSPKISLDPKRIGDPVPFEVTTVDTTTIDPRIPGRFLNENLRRPRNNEGFRDTRIPDRFLVPSPSRGRRSVDADDRERERERDRNDGDVVVVVGDGRRRRDVNATSTTRKPTPSSVVAATIGKRAKPVRQSIPPPPPPVLVYAVPAAIPKATRGKTNNDNVVVDDDDDDDDDDDETAEVEEAAAKAAAEAAAAARNARKQEKERKLKEDEDRKNNATRALIEQANERLLSNATADVERRTSESIRMSMNETRRMMEQTLDRAYERMIERILNETRRYVDDAAARVINQTAKSSTTPQAATVANATPGSESGSLRAQAMESNADGNTPPPTCELSEKQRVERDLYLLRNVSIYVESRDEDNPEKANLVRLTPTRLARRLRMMQQSSLGKPGMVSVCYHNQPSPFSRYHPLAPNDTAQVSALFNGTMDAMHRPDKGQNMDSPNYVSALVLELMSLGKDYASVCWESVDSNLDFFHDTQCVNVLVKRNNGGASSSTPSPVTIAPMAAETTTTTTTTTSIGDKIKATLADATGAVGGK